MEEKNILDKVIVFVTLLVVICLLIYTTQKSKTEHTSSTSKTTIATVTPSVSIVVTITPVPTEIPADGPTLAPQATPILRELPPNVSGVFKPYMCYTALSCKTSAQHLLQHSAYTDAKGFRRVGRRYMVAMGSYYADYIGQMFIITFADSSVIDVIIGDVVADKDSDVTHRYNTSNNAIVEFIVDTSKMSKYVLRKGTVSPLLTYSPIIKIEELQKTNIK